MRKIERLYTSLINHLDTRVVDENQLPQLTWQDLWYGQTDFPELAEAIEYPAVFYEFQSDNIESLGVSSKTVDLICSLYVAYNTFLDTNNQSLEQNEGLAFMRLLGDIDEVLEGQNIGDIGVVRQVAFTPYNTRTNVIVYRIDYAITFIDEAALLENNDTQTHTFEEEQGLGIDRETQPNNEVVNPTDLKFDICP